MHKLIDKITELEKLLIYMQNNAKQQDSKEGEKFIAYTNRWLKDLNNSKQTTTKANEVLERMEKQIDKDLIRARKAVGDIKELGTIEIKKLDTIH